MTARLFPLPLLVLTCATAFAGEPGFAEIATPAAADSPWRVGAGYAQLFGLKTEFTGLGAFQSPNTVQPGGHGLDRDYDNGYVHIDSSGNLGGRTWAWAYEDDSQYNPDGSGSINYSITNSLANADTDEDGGGRPGVEIFAYYDMGAARINGLGNRQSTWGFRLGLQYSRIDVSNDDRLSTNLTITSDSYDLGGNIPEPAPFAGNPDGPGILLADNPTRTVFSGTGLVSGSRDLDVDLTILSLGSYLEIPVAEKLDVLLEAGVSLGVASGDYDFNSATTVTGVGTQTSNGSDSSTDLLPGLYLGIGVIYRINDDWSILGSGRYQYMDNYDLSSNGSKASLSFDSAFVISLSGVYSF